MSIERRRTPRKTLTDLAFINLEPDNGGIVVDVSEDGLGFHSAVPVEASGPVKFWFSIRSIDRLDASGEIAWTDESRKSGGIRFVELNDEAREKLRIWLGSGREDSRVNTSGGVTPGSPADVARQASARMSAANPALFGSMRREVSAPVTQNATPENVLRRSVGRETQETARTNSSATTNEGANVAAVAPPVDVPRPSILTSPLSLLATEPVGGASSRGYGNTEGTLITSQSSEYGSRDRSSLPMFVVILAAIAVTVAGYYTLRWKNPPRRRSSQQISAPANVPPLSSSSATVPDGSAISPAAPQSDSSPVAAAGEQAATQPPIEESAKNPANSNPSEPPRQKPSDAKLSTNTANAAAAVATPTDISSPELDEARTLLRGADGGRQAARAAQLLWTAVGNGSVAAEVELARLYIAGDGVRKNCEQARVLLRAAMSKGSEEATQQLAQLARTGCSK